MSNLMHCMHVFSPHGKTCRNVHTLHVLSPLLQQLFNRSSSCFGVCMCVAGGGGGGREGRGLTQANGASYNLGLIKSKINS